MSGRINHNPTIVEARAALPVDAGVKCRQSTWTEDARNRRMSRGENPRRNGLTEKNELT